MDEGSTQLQVRILHRAQQQDRARLGDIYAGVYNFGHNADNPLSTGNGYANALLGVFTTYTERTIASIANAGTGRLTRTRRTAGASLRAFTLDYGLRVTHHGAIYEVRDMNSAFDPTLLDPKKAPCSTSRIV